MRPLEQELAAHAKALRGLARVLVGDQDADDLLQDTALQVLAAPPPRPTGLRGFLMAVLRRRAIKRHRGDRRRVRREQALPPDEPSPSPAKVVEHKETLQRLIAALAALPEPYVGTLLQRFFEDEKPSEIAARTGVPLATVKSRLQRGLLMLREKLDADGRGDWRPALGALFGWEIAGKTATAATFTVAGVLLMSTGAKFALSAAAAVLLVVVMAWMTFGGPAASAPQPIAGSAAPVAAVEATADEQASGAQPADDLVDITATARVAAPTEPTLRGRCIDENGLPLGGIPLELRRSSNPLTNEVDTPPAYAAWLLAHPDAPWRDLPATTGPDGRFTFSFVVPPTRFMLHLDRDGIDHFVALGSLHAGRTRELGDVTLLTTCVLHGRLVDSDGAAVHDAEVWVQRHREGNETMSRVGSIDPSVPVRSTSVNALPQPQAFTAADGRFLVRLQAGNYDVSVQRRKIVRGDRFTAPVGAAFVAHEVTVAALGADESLSGTVVDARDQPVAGATVSGRGLSWVEATTDEAGHFTLVRAGDRGTTVSLSARKGNAWNTSAVARWGARDVRLVLADPVTCTLELHVTGPDGAPVTDYRVRGYGTLADYDWKRADGHHDDGIARLPGVPRLARFVLVECDRGELGDSGFVPLPLPKQRGALLRLDIALPANGDRLLRVLRPDGSAASGIAVELLDARPAMPDGDAEAQPLARIRQPELLRPGKQARLLQAGKTDARGELLLHGPRPVPLCVRLPGPGHQPVLLPCQFDASEPLVVTLQQGGRVAGQFGPPAVLREMRQRVHGGAPVLGGRSDRARSKWDGIRLRRSQGASLEYLPSLHEGGAVPAEDGTFTLDGVPPGTWQVILPRWDDSSWPEKAEELPALATVAVRNGDDTPLRLDLPDWLLASVDAQVLANGHPYGKQQVIVIYGDRTRLVGKGLQTDAEGRFQLRSRQGELHLYTSAQTTRGGLSEEKLWARDVVFVGAGEKATAVFHLDSGNLRLRLLDADGHAAADVRLYLRGSGGAVHMPSSSDVEGRIEAEVEPGEFTALVLPSRLVGHDLQLALRARQTQSLTDPLAVNLLTIGTVTVKIGETNEVELRLPPEWNR